jgi:glucose-6-phosphate 1-dehydrogenase
VAEPLAPLVGPVAHDVGDAQTTGMPTPDDHVIVLFGASGDLARRKLLPGMFHLQELGLMPERFRIVGTSRNAMTDADFRALAADAQREFGRSDPQGDAWDRFADSLAFVGIGEGLEGLSYEIDRARTHCGREARILHYLSVPPSAAPDIVNELGSLGLAENARVIMEKPFGTDLASARALNDTVHRVFDEQQVFRIDHFIGKEAVQNLLALRFANGIFEPIWNRNHIDHIQIDVPETLSVGSRAGFYEGTGAYRDMVVTHLFQVLGFVAMEPPVSLQQAPLISEKTKVFDSMRHVEPEDVVRGQYAGYRDEPGVPPDSDTDTFVALRVDVDNWRWADVPFYLRTGKRMAEGAHLLTVAFKAPPRRMFPVDCRYSMEDFGSDHLTIELGDPGSIEINFMAKVPGPTISLGEAHMGFDYASAFGGAAQALEAYERLIHDVMLGDRTLFTTAAGIERLWEISAPLLDNPPRAEPYPPGSWGPERASELISPRRWHLPGDHV